MLALERKFARVEEVLRDACGKQFTGAVARIEHKGKLQFEQAYGVTRADDLAKPVYLDTVFDLASITKVFVASMALRLISMGWRTLDDPMVDIFPEWAGKAHEAITLRMLLAHNSGMDSGADYRKLLGKDVVKYALTVDLVAQPGEKVVYSDLGFIVLGEAMQRSQARIRHAGYRPSPKLALSIPATEDDGWRGRVQGVVHDEKAYLMGGVAGHAGIFGSAAFVARLAELYLSDLRNRPTPSGESDGLFRDLRLEAITEQAYDPILRRGLGWALKTSDTNSCGRYFSANSFGHTGFVGTCVWADPQRDCSGVLLTNSVYFGRNDTRDLRAAFYEAMIEDLGLV